MVSLNIAVGKRACWAPKRAIVFYESTQGYQSTRAAALHPVVSSATSPHMLGAGTPLSEEDFAGLLEEMGKGLNFWVHPRVIHIGAYGLIWYLPAGRRRLFWQTKNPKLDAFNGKPIHTPPLLFSVTGEHLRVFALPRDERPNQETRLMTAPFYNIDSNGSMCRGSTRPPHDPRDVEAWEQLFFESAFTHPGGNVSRLIKGGLEKMLLHASENPIPLKSLVPTCKRVKDLCHE